MVIALKMLPLSVVSAILVPLSEKTDTVYLIMAFDAGTTSSRCILFDHAGNVCALAQQEFEQFFPKPGWVEHDAEEIWSGICAVMRDALAQSGLSASDYSAGGLHVHGQIAAIEFDGGL